MPDTITTEFLALRDRYIASCFTKLNPVQQRLCLPPKARC